MIKAKYICSITVKDPDNDGEVELEVWKDPTTDGIFALDASFLDQVSSTMQSPFDSSVELDLPASEPENNRTVFRAEKA